jgi:hypothetical protein
MSLGAALAAVILAGGGFWAGRATAPVAVQRPATVADTAEDDSYSDDGAPAPSTPASSGTAPSAHHARGRHGGEAGAAIVAAATKASGTKYVHRNNSDLRKAPSYAAETIKKEPKGAALKMVALSDKWAEVQDGAVKGWMRASVLKDDPPDAPGTKHPRKKKSDDGEQAGGGD